MKEGSKVWIVALVATVLVAAIFVWPLSQPDKKTKVNIPLAPTAGLKGTDAVIEWKKKFLSADSYFLSGYETSEKQGKVTQEFFNRLKMLISKYKDVSDMTKEISKINFKVTYITGVINQGNYHTHYTADESREPGQVLVFLIPEKFASENSLTKNTIWYHPGNQIIYLHAIEYDDIFLASSIFHELGHHHLHETQKPTFGRDFLYPPGNHEGEVKMYSLAFDVINAATQDKYGATIREIVKRCPTKTAERSGNVIRGVTIDDLNDIKEIRGMTQVGKRVIGMVIVQTFQDLLHTHIDTYCPDPYERLYFKIGWYEKSTSR